MLNASLQSRAPVNMGPYERIASVLAGAFFAAIGMRSRRVGRVVGALGFLALTARGATGHCAVKQRLRSTGHFHAHKAVTILRSPSEVYRVWRDFTNLPRFMRHIDRVETLSDGVSEWEMSEGPLKLKWKAEIVEDVPGQRIVWRSLPGGDVFVEGVIDLEPAYGGRGTELHANLSYDFPTGLAARVFRKLVERVGEVQLAGELRRLKQLLETGELARGERRATHTTKQEWQFASKLLRRLPADNSPQEALS